MPFRLVTLTTDFGLSSHYVAQMKGVMLGINPQLQLVDLSHAVPPQQVRQAAFLLQQTVAAFPPDTCHLVVVDPGVGTKRRILLTRIRQQYFLAPDNGVLSLVAQDDPPQWIRELAACTYRRQDPSPTFHGRDVIAPAAAHWSLGVEPDAFGPPIEQMQVLAPDPVIVEAQTLTGRIVFVDSFGNLITDLAQPFLARIPPTAVVAVQLGQQPSVPLVKTYAERPTGALVALIGSGGFLELARVNGNAASTLGVRVGDSVTVSWGR